MWQDPDLPTNKCENNMKTQTFKNEYKLVLLMFNPIWKKQQVIKLFNLMWFVVKLHCIRSDS